MMRPLKTVKPLRQKQPPKEIYFVVIMFVVRETVIVSRTFFLKNSTLTSPLSTFYNALLSIQQPHFDEMEPHFKHTEPHFDEMEPHFDEMEPHFKHTTTSL